MNPVVYRNLLDRFYLRQRDICDKASLIPVGIIGCGASGSAIGILLAKLGVPNMVLYDGDRVEDHNLPNQYYPNDSVGKNKAKALKDVIQQYVPTELLPMVVAFDRHFTEDDVINTRIVFMLVDGLDERRKIFKKLKRCNSVEWVIDTRMGAEYYEVHCINMKSAMEIAMYESAIRNASPSPLPCTGRSVIYNVMSMGALAVSMFKKMVAGEQPPRMIGYDLRNNIQIIDDSNITRRVIRL